MSDDSEKPTVTGCPVCKNLVEIYATHTERTLREIIADRDAKIASYRARLIALGCTDKDVVTF